jgi:hypothetical protein
MKNIGKKEGKLEMVFSGLLQYNISISDRIAVV